MSDTVTAFPPTAPTVLPGILPAYVFRQYSDDEAVGAFFDAFNNEAQNYQDWFVNTNLPLYTGLSGSLLDWIAEGLYGISRPSLPYGQIVGIGLFNTWMFNQIEINSFQTSGVISDFTTTDDIFKRIITWFFFKGDGQYFCTTWLKRRVKRFLIGTSGTAPNIDNTYEISVVFTLPNIVTITITIGSDSPFTLQTAQILQSAVASGAVCLPFQLQFSVSIINATTNLFNSGGVLNVTSSAGYPPAGSLPAGSIYSNGGVVSVVSPVTPNPLAPPVFFDLITAAQLLTLGGANLPTSGVTTGSQQLWNPSGLGEVWIA